jgi:hypothetical protein
MNANEVSAYLFEIPESDIIWTRRDPKYRSVINGKSKTLGMFRITARRVEQ